MRGSEAFGIPLKILPTQNPIIFNNFFLEKDAFATIIYIKKIPSIDLNKLLKKKYKDSRRFPKNYPIGYGVSDGVNWVRKNSESEWELPKRNGLVTNRNDIRGNIISWLV